MLPHRLVLAALSVLLLLARAAIQLNAEPQSGAGRVVATVQPPRCSNIGADTLSDATLRDRYVVVLRDSTRDPQQVAYSVVRDSAAVKYTFKDLIVGFAAKLTKTQVDSLCRDPGVESLDDDGYITFAEVDATDTREADEDRGPGDGGLRERTAPYWSVGRIYRHDLPSPNRFSVSADGSGVQVYLIDSGIRVSHQEFAGLARIADDAMSDRAAGADCHGHGTHVGAAISGQSYGVAPRATIQSVRVVDCRGYGTVSSLLKGLDWVSKNLQRPAVVNISLGAWRGDDNAGEVATAVNRLIDQGAVVVTAAGNFGYDACYITPALVPRAITVAASTDEDERWRKSNWGTCVDIFAPGAPVRSAAIRSDKAYRNMKGTSMAAGIVSGAAALFLQQNPQATPEQVAAWLTDNATLDKLRKMKAQTPNRLLFIPTVPTQSSPRE